MARLRLHRPRRAALALALALAPTIVAGARAAAGPSGGSGMTAERADFGFGAARVVAFAGDEGVAGAPGPAAPEGAALALATPGLDWIGVPTARARSISSTDGNRGALPMLSPERAQILLRSLTVPGWGQATLGRNGAAKVFFLIEGAVWASFVAFQIQEQMRRDSYERSARLHAGIELNDRDEEFRRIVGNYLSSDDYNQFVVYRDAANLYYDDPDRMRAYIAEHELKGADAWRWASEDEALRYRAQRKDSQRAEQRANTSIALAVVNRFVSALHAMRSAGRPVEAKSWNFEVAPAESGEALALRCGVRARF